MGLDSVLNTARQSLSANAKQIAVSARNVAGANDPNYSRKLAPTIVYEGGVRAAGPTRAGDARLHERYLTAAAASARDEALLAGLTRLSETVGDTADGTSLVARIGTLSDRLTAYANAPTSDALGRAVVTGAQDLARAITEAVATVDAVRNDAAADIKVAVDRINGLLRDFERVNESVVRGSILGTDITDDLDRRDALLAQLSEEIGLSVVTRANNDMVLYTDGGVTLFETSARAVRADIVAGEPVRVFVDGVQVAGDAAPMPSKSGRLVGLAELHNEVAAEYGRQLDMLAFGLIWSFREIDPATVSPGPDRAGLFTIAADSAGTVIPNVPPVTGDPPPDPPILTATPGLPDPPPAGESAGWFARLIAVNAAVDPARGGDPAKLRDGVSYSYNTESAGAYSEHLFAQLARLDQPIADQATVAGLPGRKPIDFAAESVGWVEGGRQVSASAAQSSAAVLQLVTTSLSNARGVDVNDEAALQLQIERSFQASAQLLAIVNSLYETLLSVVR